MDEQEQKLNQLPIPKPFLAEDTGKPIDRCIDCGHDLMLDDRYYVIEKVFKRYPNLNKTEVLFEYAICHICYDKMKKDSRLKVWLIYLIT